MNAAQRPAIQSAMQPVTPFSQPGHSNPNVQDSSAGSSNLQGNLQSSRQSNRQSNRQATQRSVKRVPYAGARQAIAFESSVKLTVNLLLAVVATTTIAKLVPYYQSQQSRLTTLQESVYTAEKKNAELRDQFSRNFDPTQASRIMQEQSGMSYPDQKKVIWKAPLKTAIPNTASDRSNAR